MDISSIFQSPVFQTVVKKVSDRAKSINQEAEDQDRMAWQLAYNRSLTQDERNWQLEMWNKLNEYNLPINQRKRLEEAGINPNVAFGNSASTMAAPVGSLPTHKGTSSEGWANRKLERQQVLAQVNQLNENTRRERNNNNLFEYLLNDKKLHDALSLKSDMVEYEWNLLNKQAALNEGLYKLQLGNQILEKQKELKDLEKEILLAKKNQEWKRVKMLEQEYTHLMAKYGFEDFYYNQRLNPYETSTVAGALRTVGGLFSNIGSNPNSPLHIGDSNPVWRHDVFMLGQMFKQGKKDWNYWKNNWWKTK